MTDRLIGFNTSVAIGQEYRLLVHDRKDDEYRFIALHERRETFITRVLGEDVRIMRYSPETAYVFRTSQTFPHFSSMDIEGAKTWASERCLEYREIPKWWKTDSDEVQDTGEDYDPDEGYARLVNEKYEAKEKLRKQDLNYHI